VSFKVKYLSIRLNMRNDKFCIMLLGSRIYASVILSCFLLLSLPVLAQSEESVMTTPGGTSFLFSYNRRQSSLLIKDYMFNRVKCEQLNALISKHRSDILSGRSHLAVVAYIRPQDLGDPHIINMASVQASVARAYVKIMHSIDHEYFTFSFDTAHYTNYHIRVDYITAPIPEYANQFIYYTQMTDPEVISRSVKRYEPIPLVGKRTVNNGLVRSVPFDVNGDLSNGINELSDIMDKTALIKSTHATRLAVTKDSVSVANTSLVSNQSGVRIHKSDSDSVSQHASYHSLKQLYAIAPLPVKSFTPFFSVKTNLLYWGGISPDLKRRDLTPNIEFEAFFAQRWSFNVDASYIHISKKNAEYEVWGVSSVGVEPRLWFNNNAHFNGFYCGVYGQKGDFDIKSPKKTPEGQTGIFNEAGVSLGLNFPFCSRWGLELGGRFGYRKVSYDTYRSEASANYYQSSFEQNGFRLTGIRLLLSYRFGKFQINKTK
jgi:Protein of unknown function (DUF3575)